MAYIRKTYDEYQLISNYGYGWDIELTESTRKDINERRQEYLENCPQGRFKIKTVRVKIKEIDEC